MKEKILLYTIIIVTSFFIINETKALDYEERSFVVTGYYSPLKTQKYFLTGSYKSEIRLNGNGKRGADMTAVHAGMIAAPKSYAFGTSICLEGIGCGHVHDRGQAIVEKGQRKIAKHDRLDIWMGYGEIGLKRALKLGVRTIKGKIYNPGVHKNNSILLANTPAYNDLIKIPEHAIFKKNIGLNSQGKEVTKMQKALKEINFFKEEPNSYFGPATKKAITEFQKAEYIIKDKYSQGVGYFGPKTREKLSQKLFEHKLQINIEEMWNSFSFKTRIKRGQINAEVTNLQQILVQEEFLNVSPTGFFGPLTKEALIKFQKKYNLIENEKSQGAGQIGPETREELNKVIRKKIEKIQTEHENIQKEKQFREKSPIFKSFN